MDEERSAALGEVLRRARGARSLTVQQVADITRIPVRHLEALERGDLEAVPGGRFYLRAEILAYAEVVGVSPDAALALLRAAVDPPVAVAMPTPTVSSPSRRTVASIVSIMTIAAAGLAIAAVVTWRAVPRVGPAQPEPLDRVSLSVDATASNAPSGTTGSAALLDTATAVDQQAIPAEPELEIISEPAGAQVTVDGVGWGVTPVTIRYLSPGRKQVRVTRDGFAAEERLVRVPPDKPITSVRVELRQLE